jgi:4-hydroxy-tetrahydrodipicolinate synthase
MPDTILRIAKEVPLVVGVKEASGSTIQHMDIIKNAPAHFCVLSGDDALTFPLLALGGDGIISVASNEAPKMMSELCIAAQNNDWETARKIHYEWLDLMNVNFVESNPQPVKAALAMMGMITESYRLPLVPVDAKNKEKIREVLKKHKLI